MGSDGTTSASWAPPDVVARVPSVSESEQHAWGPGRPAARRRRDLADLADATGGDI
jgi:hypothetical protein